MSREIKFRAWDTQKKKFDYDVMILRGEACYIDSFDSLEFYKEGRMILQQFSGLHDKNGKEIYEGDFLKDISGDKHVVQYFQPDARYISVYANEYASGEWDDADEAIGLVCVDCEVIGNIYEHQYLL